MIEEKDVQEKKKESWLRRKWPIRKGCFHCGANLKTGAEKFTRTCSSCAAGAREGFAKMGEGQFKEGFSKVTDTLFQKDSSEVAAAKTRVVAEKVHGAISKKERLLRKKLKKQGLTPDEIEKGLGEYKKHMGR